MQRREFTALLGGGIAAGSGIARGQERSGRIPRVGVPVGIVGDSGGQIRVVPFHRQLGAAEYRLPAVYPYRFLAADGGLVSYGVDPIESFRRAAAYVDRLPRGARPADLPSQRPHQFGPVVNLKGASALGLNVPTTLLARANEVRE
jgi:hypothetical protein